MTRWRSQRFISGWYFGYEVLLYQENVLFVHSRAYHVQEAMSPIFFSAVLSDYFLVFLLFLNFSVASKAA